MPEINIYNYSYKYAAKPILNKIDLDINVNTSVAIVGLSGCGKSTLLKRISGIEPKLGFESGNIQIDKMLPEQYLDTKQTSFMFQEPTLLPNLNVKENLEFPLNALNLPNNEISVNHYLDLIGLQDFKYFLPNKLSGGMKTRVALARSFISKPKLLLLDEPFSSLDIGWQIDLYNKLNLLKAEISSTLILVTHNIIEALYLCNTVYVLGKSGEFIQKIQINQDLPRTYPLKETAFRSKIEFDLIWQTLETDKFQYEK